MENHFQLSSHLRFASKNTHIYHSLFGNLCRIDDELYQFLRNFSGQISYADLLATARESTFVLLDNYFLVASEQEERSLINNWLAERETLIPTGHYLESLQISTSNLCNFACSYCFADSSDRRSERRTSISKQQPTLTFDVGVKGIDQLLANATRHDRNNVGVKFLGREPLVNWKTIQKLLDHYQGRGIQWSITTNGSLITPQIAETLAKHQVMTVVSLDGPPESNNTLRILKDSSSTYEVSERGIRALSAAGARFGVSSVLSRATHFNTFLPFVHRMADYGARELELTLVMQTAIYQAQTADYGKDELLDFLLEVYRESKQVGVSIHGDWVDPFHRLLTTHKRRDESEVVRAMPAGCSATSHQISLESNGDLFPCRAMSLHYGHIDDLSQALSSDAYRSVGMRTFYNVPFCNGCMLEGFCQGTCLGSCEESSDDIYQPQLEYCEVYQEMTSRLLDTLNHTKESYEDRSTVR